MLCFLHLSMFFFFKQKTAYEMRISDWSSDVCSSDLQLQDNALRQPSGRAFGIVDIEHSAGRGRHHAVAIGLVLQYPDPSDANVRMLRRDHFVEHRGRERRTEEPTSEHQSLMRNSYSVFCIKIKKTNHNTYTQHN